MTADYLRIIRAYRIRESPLILEELARYPAEDLKRVGRELREHLGKADGSVTAQDLQAALVMHLLVVARAMATTSQDAHMGTIGALLESPSRFIPRDVRHKSRMAQVALLQRDMAVHDLAVVLDSALGEFKNDPTVLLAQGTYWELLGALPDSILDPLPRAMSLEPVLIMSPRGTDLRPLAINRTALYRHCLQLYDRLVRYAPGMIEAHVRRGAVLLKLERPREAVVLLQEVANRHDAASYLRYQAALLAGRGLLSSGDAVGAARVLSVATELYEDCQTPWLASSAALRTSGDRLAAERALNTALNSRRAAGCWRDPWLEYHYGQAWLLDQWLNELERAVIR